MYYRKPETLQRGCALKTCNSGLPSPQRDVIKWHGGQFTLVGWLKHPTPASVMIMYHGKACLRQEEKVHRVTLLLSQCRTGCKQNGRGSLILPSVFYQDLSNLSWGHSLNPAGNLVPTLQEHSSRNFILNKSFIRRKSNPSRPLWGLFKIKEKRNTHRNYLPMKTIDTSAPKYYLPVKKVYNMNSKDWYFISFPLILIIFNAKLKLLKWD